MRSRKRYPRAATDLLTTVIASLCGFAAVFACIMLFSFLMTRIDVSDQVLSVLTSAALCVGAYAGGYAASRRRKQNGLLMGVLCGLLMFAVIFVMSYFFAGTAGGFSGTPKLIMTLVCAAAGGIVGANSSGNWFRFK